MSINSENPVSIIHRTHDILRRGEDKVLGELGLSTEQYGLLTAIESLDGPARVTDVALRLMRSVNSVSMLADRMVKAGLIKRVRDKKDRRTVHLSITSKAEDLIKSANPAGRLFIEKVLVQLSYEDEQTLIRILLAIQCEALAII
jgi:DNA-binding MarR family transcriptional regulator